MRPTINKDLSKGTITGLEGRWARKACGRKWEKRWIETKNHISFNSNKLRNSWTRYPNVFFFLSLKAVQQWSWVFSHWTIWWEQLLYFITSRGLSFNTTGWLALLGGTAVVSEFVFQMLWSRLAKDLNNISNTQIGCLKRGLRLDVCNLCSESTTNTYFFAN